MEQTTTTIVGMPQPARHKQMKMSHKFASFYFSNQHIINQLQELNRENA